MKLWDKVSRQFYGYNILESDARRKANREPVVAPIR
jgi:hypothetical protein